MAKVETKITIDELAIMVQKGFTEQAKEMQQLRSELHEFRAENKTEHRQLRLEIARNRVEALEVSTVR